MANEEIKTAELLSNLEKANQEKVKLEKELETLRSEIEEFKTITSSFESYKSFVSSQFSDIYKELPEYIRSSVNEESFKDKPLQGIKFLNTFKGITDKIKEELSGDKKDDQQDPNKKDDPDPNKKEDDFEAKELSEKDFFNLASEIIKE